MSGTIDLMERLLNALEEDERKNIQELADEVESNSNTVSRYLTMLRRTDIVREFREGRQRNFRLARRTDAPEIEMEKMELERMKNLLTQAVEGVEDAIDLKNQTEDGN